MWNIVLILACILLMIIIRESGKRQEKREEKKRDELYSRIYKDPSPLSEIQRRQAIENAKRKEELAIAEKEKTEEAEKFARELFGNSIIEGSAKGIDSLRGKGRQFEK